MDPILFSLHGKNIEIWLVLGLTTLAQTVIPN